MYTQKELVFMEASIEKFHEKFYIPDIQRLEFHLTYVHILVTHHCDKELCEAFNISVYYQYVKCCCDYYKCLVARFENQIQLEYYGGNISISMECIELEHYCVEHILNLPLCTKSLKFVLHLTSFVI